MSEVKIKLKTVNKFLMLFNECRDKKRVLTVQEIATTINCSKGTLIQLPKGFRETALFNYRIRQVRGFLQLILSFLLYCYNSQEVAQ